MLWAVATVCLAGCTPEPITVYPVAEQVTAGDKEPQRKDVSKEPPLRFLVVPETQTVVLWPGDDNLTWPGGPGGNLARCSAIESDCKKGCTVLDARTWKCTQEFIDTTIHVHSMENGTYRFMETKPNFRPGGHLDGERETIRIYKHRTWLRRALLFAARVLAYGR